MPKDDFVDILSVATKGQLFQFNGALYKLKQISDVLKECEVWRKVFSNEIMVTLVTQGLPSSLYRPGPGCSKPG